MFITASGVFQIFGRLDSLVLLALSIGTFLLWTRWMLTARWVVTVVVCFMLLITIFYVPEWLAYPLESEFPPLTDLPAHVDGIVAINGVDTRKTALAGELRLDDSAEVFLEFEQLASLFPKARCVLSVGATEAPSGRRTAAEIVRAFLVRQAIGLENVLIEDQSHRTADRIPFLRTLAQPKLGETWLLVTSALRARRNVEVFNSAGWNVIAVPVGRHVPPQPGLEFAFARNLWGTWLVLKEWIGMAAYRATSVSL